jgi:hypothetical protein
MTTAGARAQCGCGSLSVTVSGEPVLQVICHCIDCRAVTGDPHTEVVFFRLGEVTVHGEPRCTQLVGASGQPKRYLSCARCDEFLFGEVGVLGGVCGIRPRSLGSGFSFSPRAHVWTSQREASEPLDDGLPAFPRAPRR